MAKSHALCTRAQLPAKADAPSTSGSTCDVSPVSVILAPPGETTRHSTDHALWASYQGSLAGTASAPDMRFPSRTPPEPGPLRVSEQEARHLFCALAPSHGYGYSLETPTQATYKQSGSKPTRARFDASLLNESGARLWNVEFKHGGISPSSKSKAVYKDIEKLLVDPGDGVWFHLLEHIDNATIVNLIARIRADVAAVASAHRVDDRTELAVHICILEPAFSIHRVVEVAGLIDESIDLGFSHQVSKGTVSLIEGAWQVHKNPDADSSG